MMCEYLWQFTQQWLYWTEHTKNYILHKTGLTESLTLLIKIFNTIFHFQEGDQQNPLQTSF